MILNPVCNKFFFRCNHSEMYEMFCVVIFWAHLHVSVVCWSWNSVAFIEASLEELPMSADLGQSCLATKISAPGPSNFGWFRHNFRNKVLPDGQLLYWHYCCTLWNLRSFCRYNIYLLTICRWWMVVFLSVIIISVLLSIVFEWKWNYTTVDQCLSPFVNFHCVTY